MAPTKPFDKETELCAHFIEDAKSLGWKIYPETAGFDILCVATATTLGRHFNQGDQLGIQAKLSPNMDVLYQSLPPTVQHATRHNKGPHYFGILVPFAPQGFHEVAGRLGIKVFEAAKQLSYRRRQNKVGVLEPCPVAGLRDYVSKWPASTTYAKRCWVPEYEVDIEAGAPGPMQLTLWKDKALRLVLHGQHKGYLTTKDFKTFDVSMVRWVKNRWIVGAEDPVIEDGKRYKRFLVNDVSSAPHMKNPEIMEALRNLNGK